ncbi:hypothetical protein AHAS_Ahas13G0335500 [Arachis hypogaea]
MPLEDEKRFNIYWNFNVSSPKIRINGINASELVSINMLMLLWNECPLSLTDIMVNEQATQNVVGFALFLVDMVGGLVAIAAMKKRLESQSKLLINVNGDRVSSSVTINHLPPTPKTEGGGEGQDPEIHILAEDSPISSREKKKN